MRQQLPPFLDMLSGLHLNTACPACWLQIVGLRGDRAGSSTLRVSMQVGVNGGCRCGDQVQVARADGLPVRHLCGPQTMLTLLGSAWQVMVALRECTCTEPGPPLGAAANGHCASAPQVEFIKPAGFLKGAIQNGGLRRCCRFIHGDAGGGARGCVSPAGWSSQKAAGVECLKSCL